MTPIDAESLVIVQGFARWLSPGRAVTTNAHRTAAERLPKTIAAACRAFFEDKPSGRPERLPDLDYEATRDALLSPPSPSTLAEKTIGLDDDAPEVIAVAGAAWKYLADALPKRTVDTPIGPKAAGAGHSEILKFRRQFAAVDRPIESVFGDLASGTLSRAQSRCFAEVFPNVFAFSKSVLWAELTAHVGEKDTLARWRQRALEAFLDIAATPGAIAAEYQAKFSKPTAAAEPPAAPGSAPVMPDMSTSTQRVEMR